MYMFCNEHPLRGADFYYDINGSMLNPQIHAGA